MALSEWAEGPQKEMMGQLCLIEKFDSKVRRVELITDLLIEELRNVGFDDARIEASLNKLAEQLEGN